MKRLFKDSIIVILLSGTTIYLPSCKKEATLPIVITTIVSDITQTTAAIGGNITDDGGDEVNDRGICWSTSPYPAVTDNKTSNGTGIGSFTCNITGLTANTKYYVRAYATNRAGTSYGIVVAFNTALVVKSPTVPALTTTEVTSVTPVSAMSGGNITDDGGGVISVMGVYLSTTPGMDVYFDYVSGYAYGTGPGFFINYLPDLNPGTTYYVKAYAVNNSGKAFGPTLSFTTSEISPVIFNPDLTYGSVSDIDGNVYKTIQIGSQIWMTENLRTTKYNDGTSIPDVTDNTEWSNLTTGGYSWYNNNALFFKTIYGALYNWYAVNDNRKLCPTGWHVPTDVEWTTLLTYLDGILYSGAKLKETGTTHWLSPNILANNETGFTALPGGYRSVVDPEWNSPSTFALIGSNGLWWSATGLGYGDASSWSVSAHSIEVGVASQYLNYGMSVRCIKDI